MPASFKTRLYCAVVAVLLEIPLSPAVASCGQSIGSWHDRVAADLGSIFADVPQTINDPKLPRAMAVTPRRRARRRIRPLAAAAALVAFTASAGFIGGRTYRPAPVVLPNSVASHADASSRPIARLPMPAFGQVGVSVPSSEVTLQAQPAPAAIRKPGVSTASAIRGAHMAPASRHSPSDRDVCGTDGAAEPCLGDEVIAADDRLRAEYEAATDAGVPRSILVAVRQDWSRLRQTASDDPRGMIRGYRALTAELRREQGW